MKSIHKLTNFGIIMAVMALLLSVINVPAYASDTASGRVPVSIYDGADLLTDEEESSLKQQLSGYSSDINYLVVTENSYMYSGGDMHTEMDGLYNAIYGGSDGVAFVINMQDRQLYTGGFGKCAKDLRSSDARDITDNVYRYASNGDYYTCISRAFEQINTVINNGVIVRPMRYVVSILLGLLFGFTIMFFAVIISRNNKKPATVLPEGIGRTAVKSAIFTGAVNGMLMNAVMHKHVRSSGSSSGGSSGGGGFSGGGSSGGGHGF